MRHRSPKNLSFVALASLVTVLLTACGGGSDDDSPPLTVTPPDSPTETLTVNTSIAGFPHAIDIYRPANATRAVILLHGGLGTKDQIAYNVGINLTRNLPTTTSVNWNWLRERGVILVTPQGQAINGSPANTWSNYVMTSGQDDVGFLKALAQHVRTTYGVSEVYLMGHSMGAVMTNRMWCESGATFNGYAAFAGPAAVGLQGGACRPDTKRPYYGIVGAQDTVLQASDWSAPTWTLTNLVANTAAFVNPVVVGEWAQFVARSNDVCNENVSLTGKVVADNIETWTSCSGRLRVRHALALDHSLGMPNGTVLIDGAMSFLDSAR